MLRSSWDNETPPVNHRRTIHPSPDSQTPKDKNSGNNYQKPISGQKRRKYSGLGFLVSLVLITTAYFGGGAIIRNIGGRSWQRQAKEYSIFVWPRVFIDSEGEYNTNTNSDYQNTRSTSQSSNREYNENNHPQSSNREYNKNNSTSRDNSDYEINEITERSMEQMRKLGDAQLWEGKTRIIEEIVADESLSPEEAAKRILDECPTGLPGPLDRFVKGVAWEIHKNIQEQEGN